MRPESQSSGGSLERQPGPVLVLAPTGRDAALLCKTFSTVGIAAVSCDDPNDLCTAMDEDAGCAVVVEEAIGAEARDLILNKLAGQPEWSDFSLILLANRASSTDQLRRRFPRLLGAHNVILLKRPLQKEILLSTVSSMLQSRRRQFQVRDSIEKRQNLIDALPVLVMQLDGRERCIFLNQTCARWFGLDLGASGGRPFRELVAGAFYERLRPSLRSALAGREIQLKETIAGQPVRQVFLRLTPWKGPGNEVTGLCMAAVDITDLRKSQEELAEVSHLKNIALEGARLGVWLWHLDTNSLEWDIRTHEIFGLDPEEEVYFDKFTAMLHPADRDRVVADNVRAADPNIGGVLSTRYRIVSPGGAIRWLDVQGGAIFEGKGEQRRARRMVGTVQDITEMVSLDEELRNYRERLELVHSALGIGIWEWRAMDNLITWSPEMYELFPSPRIGEPINLRRVLREVSPEDRAILSRRLTKALENAEPNWQAEFRVVHPAKGLRWLSSYGRIIFDSANRPERILGFTVDVTERKAAEENVRDAMASQALSAGLLRGREEERTRLAQELHDDFSQRLAYISMGLDLLKLKNGVPAEKVDELQNYAVQLSDDIRNLSHRLHPFHLEHLGLVPALEAECRRVQTYAGIDILFRGEGETQGLSKELQLNVYRVIQEALQNVVKHASASTARVALLCEPGKTRFFVEDDGCGFDGEVTPPGLGLRTMHERLRPFQGRVKIHSSVGDGTRLEVEIPFCRTSGT